MTWIRSIQCPNGRFEVYLQSAMRRDQMGVSQLLRIVWGNPVAVHRLFQIWFRLELAPCMSVDDAVWTLLNIEEHYARELGSSVPEGPRKLLRKLVEKGKMRNKLRDGFYEYNASAARVLPEALRRLKSQR